MIEASKKTENKEVPCLTTTLQIFPRGPNQEIPTALSTLLPTLEDIHATLLQGASNHRSNIKEDHRDWIIPVNIPTAAISLSKISLLQDKVRHIQVKVQQNA